MSKYETKYDVEWDADFVTTAEGITIEGIDIGLVLENDRWEIARIYLNGERIDDNPGYAAIWGAIRRKWRNEYNEMTPEDRRAI